MDTGLSEPPIEVCFVLLPGSLVLDWAGPAEALRIANQCLQAQGHPPAYRLRFVGPLAQAKSSVGATIAGLEPLPEMATLLANSPVWLVLLGQSGARLSITAPGVPPLLSWLRGLRPQVGKLELVTVCAGAVLAGHAGLLDGHRATTHHQHLDELRHIAPHCAVQDNRVFVLDGAISSSAGVSTGIDLFLHRISAQCGPALAAQVAHNLVLALRRGPGDPELSPFLHQRDHLHPAVHRVQDALSQAPHEPWTLARMAQRGHTSTRHLARLFAQHAGCSPQSYLQRIRLAAAQAALQSGCSVKQAAQVAGFSSDTQLRRAWHRHALAGTPRETAQVRG